MRSKAKLSAVRDHGGLPAGPQGASACSFRNSQEDILVWIVDEMRWDIPWQRVAAIRLVVNRSGRLSIFFHKVESRIDTDHLPSKLEPTVRE